MEIKIMALLADSGLVECFKQIEMIREGKFWSKDFLVMQKEENKTEICPMMR